MARTLITVQQVTKAGVTLSFSAATATDGNNFANDGDVLLYVKNGGASPITVTVQTPAKIEGVDVAELTVSVSNASEKIIGPFPTSIFNQSDGTVYVDFSAVTSVTIAAFRTK